MRDERGLVAPSRLLLVLIVVVAIAGATYVATAPDPTASAHTAAAKPTVSPSATQTSAQAAPTPTPARKPKPVVKRSDVYVEVFNNSGISGLAGRTSGKAQSVGWKVVGSDNWYGTIPATTVYYPARLGAAAKILARDLGITRIRPAIAPMRFDRLTVILTTDYTA
ncbi:MAG: LytR C-terminal domain-containing protein [Marmoricola sp.]